MSCTTPTVLLRARGFRLWVAPEYAAHARRLGLVDAAACDSLHAAGRRVPGGRGENLLVDDAGFGGMIRLRPSWHGGWLAPLLRDRFTSPKRARREFDTWRRLRARGVSLPTPVFALARRHGFFWRTSLAIRDRPMAQDGVRLLESRPAEAALFAAAEACARALRGLHDAGALHGDLHLRNLLFEFDPGVAGRRDEDASENDSIEHHPPGAARCLLIDLDRTRLVETITPADRMREWMRLARSVEKTGLTASLPQRLRFRIFRSYCDGNRRLRRAMLASLPRESRPLARHRLAWRLERKLR